MPNLFYKFVNGEIAIGSKATYSPRENGGKDYLPKSRYGKPIVIHAADYAHGWICDYCGKRKADLEEFKYKNPKWRGCYV